MKLRITIDPMVCGPVSVGTTELIKIVRDWCGIGLAEAKHLIDRAAFDGETVEVSLPADANGEELIAVIDALETPARIQAKIDV